MKPISYPFILVAWALISQPMQALILADNGHFLPEHEEALQDWPIESGRIDCLIYNQQNGNIHFCNEVDQALMQEALAVFSISDNPDGEKALLNPNSTDQPKWGLNQTGSGRVPPFEKGVTVKFLPSYTENVKHENPNKISINGSKGIQVAFQGEGICASSHRPLLKKGVIILGASFSSGFITGLMGGPFIGIVIMVGTGVVTSIILAVTTENLGRAGRIERKIDQIMGISSALDHVCSNFG